MPKRLQDENGNVYRQNWVGKWVREENAPSGRREADTFGEPRIERDALGEPKPERNIWSEAIHSADGRKLYRSAPFTGNETAMGRALMFLVATVAATVQAFTVWGALCKRKRSAAVLLPVIAVAGLAHQVAVVWFMKSGPLPGLGVTVLYYATGFIPSALLALLVASTIDLGAPTLTILALAYTIALVVVRVASAPTIQWLYGIEYAEMRFSLMAVSFALPLLAFLILAAALRALTSSSFEKLDVKAALLFAAVTFAVGVLAFVAQNVIHWFEYDASVHSSVIERVLRFWRPEDVLLRMTPYSLVQGLVCLTVPRIRARVPKW